MELITVKELAVKLKTTDGNVRKMCRERKLPYSKIPGIGIRFNQSEIESFIAKKTIKQTA